MHPTSVPPPSGRQHRLRHGRQRAVVVEVGGGLREYEVDGFQVLDGYSVEEMASAGRGQVLMPWPNRLAGGRYRFGGVDLQLPLDEPERGNAIHGLVRWSPWHTLEASPVRVRLGHRLWPRPGYPFVLALEALYELSEAGLRVTLAACNLGLEPAPFGAGQHPYLRAGSGPVDGWELRIPARSVLETDHRLIPTGRRLTVAGTELDFLRMRPVGSTRLDVAFCDLERDAHGLACAELRGQHRVRLWMDRGWGYLMAFTGDSLSGAARRRGLALEPMSCAPDAFHSGEGLVVLEPGGRWQASWGLEVT